MSPSSYMPSQGVFDHPELGACAYRLTSVSEDPDTQVAQTIDYMRGYASQDAKGRVISDDVVMARSMGTGEPINDTWNYLARHGGVRGMQFQRDEITSSPVDINSWNPIVETLIRPADQALMRSPVGDCDDFAMYGAAHLLNLGVPCAFVTIAADAGEPKMFSHVYLVAYPKSGQYAGMRVPMDLSHGQFPGWEYGQPFRLKEWPIGTSMSMIFGIGLAAVGGFILYKVLFQGVN